MGRFERFYKKESGISDPMPNFLASAGYKRVAQTGQQGATGKYTIVMTRTTIIMLGIFLLILSVVCFVGGFMLSKNIHEHKAQPIIIHTGQNAIPTQVSFNHADTSKLEIQEEAAEFESAHSGAKAAAENMSARATDKNSHDGKISKYIKAIEKKSDNIASAARDKFHKLVGIPTHQKKAATTKIAGKKDAHDTHAKASTSAGHHLTKKPAIAHKQGGHEKTEKPPAAPHHSSEGAHKKASNKTHTDAHDALHPAHKAQWTVETAPLLDSSYYNLDFYGEQERMSHHAQRRERQEWKGQAYANLNASDNQQAGYEKFLGQEQGFHQRDDVQQVGSFSTSRDAGYAINKAKNI